MSEPSTERVMVVLLGGRSAPAVLGALAARPCLVEAINSADQPDGGRQMASALRGVAGIRFGALDRRVDPYDKDAVYRLCRELGERYDPPSMVLNLSAGTKVMALGAYQLALERNIPAIYVVTNRQQVLNVTTSEQFPFPVLDIRSYLACYGRSPQSVFDFSRLSVDEQQAIALANSFVEVGQPAFQVLDLIRRRAGNSVGGPCGIDHYKPRAEQLAVWQILERTGIVQDVGIRGGQFWFTIPTKSDFEFLKGTWLEVYVWDQARKLRRENGDPVFFDARSSLEIPSDRLNARKEIDVALLYDGQLIHCSCKSGRNNVWETRHLDELSSVSQLIGGDFCSRVFVTSQPKPDEKSQDYGAYLRFLDQARDRRIVVITQEQLASIGQVLREIAEKPIYPRI